MMGPSHYYPNNIFKELLLPILAGMAVFVFKGKNAPIKGDDNYTVNDKV